MHQSNPSEFLIHIHNTFLLFNLNGIVKDIRENIWSGNDGVVKKTSKLTILGKFMKIYEYFQVESKEYNLSNTHNEPQNKTQNFLFSHKLV